MRVHTGSPWRIVEAKDDEGNPIDVLVGQVQVMEAIGQPWVPERIAVVECMANSPDWRLLIGAPELLAALEAEAATEEAIKRHNLTQDFRIPEAEREEVFLGLMRARNAARETSKALIARIRGQ